jgi:flagellin
VISVQTNLPALSGLRSLDAASREMGKSMERLATARRINRASDDPSGLMAAESLSAEEATIVKRIDRLRFESAFLAAREGGSSVVGDLLVDLQGLVARAGNKGGLSRTEREAIQIEADSILKTFDFLSNTSTFNGQRLLAGAGAQSMGLSELLTGGKLNLVDGDLEGAAEAVKNAVGGSTFDRAGLGARMREIDAESRELMNRLENVAAAKSLILDTDYAAETANLARQQVLQQAATFATSVASRTRADTALALLSGVRL